LWLVPKLRLWGDPALGWVASKFGWTWPEEAISLLPIGVGCGLLVAKVVLDGLFSGIKRLIQKFYPLPNESLALSSSASSKGISVSSTLLALAAVSDKANAKVRRRFERVGQKLDQAKRHHCVFLSMAVVDSVEMKQGSDREKVARSFDSYEAMVEEILRQTGAWKQVWTADGLMACYLDIDHALDAAQRVLQGLNAFNSQQNELPSPFRVCCGMNEGEVAIFEDSKLHKVADHAIDVAGHMQKNARPNSLWLSSEVYDNLHEKDGFHSAGAQVDGFKVFEWVVPERAPSARTAA
jgi:class 3 adenylate cyclase